MEQKNKKKIWIGIAIGSVISVLTLGTLFVVLMIFFFLGGPPKVVKDIDQYSQVIQSENLHTGLIVFPGEIPAAAQDVDFYFYFQDTWNTPTIEVYLQCTYDEETYGEEVLRLENTQKSYGSTVRTLIKEENYPYPAYVAVDGDNHTFEYALLSGERQITYISVIYKDTAALDKVEAKYLPKDYDYRMNYMGGYDGYNIYLMRTTVNSKGEVMAREYDYTREAVAEVLLHHPVSIDYNHFGVRTCLDEQDREIIQACYYTYYKDRHDSMYGLPESMEYSELQGYEYRGITLNTDKTKAVVTYYDGKEEKSMEYEIPQK